MSQITLVCTNCAKEFQRALFRYNDKIRQGKKDFFCNNSCKGTYYSKWYPYSLNPMEKKYSDDFKQEIRQAYFQKHKTHREINEEYNIPLGSISYLLRKV